ncbi:AAA family ATPase [Actibacterium pelagium]|uniref:Pilus assembly protein CpaE n=1 Tax=Actibacterium pelagium TaxID=2029103 RepID=A0A917EMC3_9RHOB|nr:AAA family ATPase [Actibacterium pelagium]GGE60152.1 pilus assembly protein CpaE [Actibacterium pelagium]
MSSNAASETEPAAITACTVARDVQHFDLLIEDMENELGENWGDLTFEDAEVFLSQPEANQLEFIAIAVDEQDEPNLPAIGQLTKTARSKGIRVILIAEEVSPVALNQLLRLGADDFVPYPLPDGALGQAIERLRAAIAAEEAAPKMPLTLDNDPEKPVGDRDGVVFAVQGVAGGVGASTFAVNLAWELATVLKKDGPKVCLLDFDFQYGSASTYLDLPRREVVHDMLSDVAGMDTDVFQQALLPFNDQLFVLTSPSDIMPLDYVSPDDIHKILTIARANFDFVVIDMPTTLVQWTETVLTDATLYFTLIELDMRAAQNTLRLTRMLKSEDLPFEKLRFALNRAPKFSDFSGKARAKRMAESLDIDIELMLPDGGEQVVQTGDHGLPLAENAKKNPLRKEIQRLAGSLYSLSVEEETGR